MISFFIARSRRVLLIEFGLPVTRDTISRLDSERAAVFEREGTMDMVVDFTPSPPAMIPVSLTHERVRLPSPAPGHRRLYVAPSDHLFGMLRMYAIPHGDDRVDVVRTIAEAFAALQVAHSDFSPLST